MSGRRRPLTREERELWAQVARAAVPLKGRAATDPPAPAPLVPSPGPNAEASPPATASVPVRPRPEPSGPTLLDRPLRRALARGQTHIEARIDLHGMTQANAHGALFGFLRRAQAEGLAVALVITGKGSQGSADWRVGDGQRGILKRLVPLWLALPEMRRVVSGYSEAGPRHGGGGALYVRLRRLGRL